MHEFNHNYYVHGASTSLSLFMLFNECHSFADLHMCHDTFAGILRTS